ncbi:MAG: biopolymer transporter ExbD [Verrucomicrobia bacterium]|nr:biopolymer transporter ExbD [Verrucomicrobiota bacterium]
MKFAHRKKRQAPAIIIISLIDILIVLLIFMMVTTSVRQSPSVQLALPASKQTRQGGGADVLLVVTVAKTEPYHYLEARAVTLAKLQEELKARAAKNPEISLFIRADTDAPFGEVVKVLDAAKAAKIKVVSALTKQPGKN